MSRNSEKGGLSEQAGLLARASILLVLFSQCSYCGQMSAEEILTKVSQTNANLQSYQFIAKKEISRRFDANIQTQTSRIDLRGAKPGKVRLSTHEPGRDTLVVSDGATIWTYVDQQKKYTEMHAAFTELEDEAEPETGRERDIVSENFRLLVGR